MDAMAAIRQTFFQECEEQLTELESGLLQLEGGEGDLETVNAVFRAVHSIKGGAGAFNLDDLVRFAHTFETTLDGLRSDRLEGTPQLIGIMLRASDILADLVRVSRDGGEVDQVRVAQMNEELARAASGGQADAAPVEASSSAPTNEEPQVDDLGFEPLTISFDDLLGEEPQQPEASQFSIRFKPRPDLYANANDAIRLLRELGRLGDLEVDCDTSEIPLLSELEPEGAYLDWTITLSTSADETAIREVFEFVELDCDLQIEEQEAAQPETLADLLQAAEAETTAPDEGHESAKAPSEPAAQQESTTAPAESAAEEKRQPPTAPAANRPASSSTSSQTTIRVNLDRVDRLIDLVGELVINQSMLTQRMVEADVAHLSDVGLALEDLGQLTREIQDSVMAIRAQPIRPIFQRMSRVVREVADITGKSVKLVTEGENCEIDNTVIERLTDPLTHMIRNAIDHGLEKPEDRVAAGKPEQGEVRMVAAHRSGRVVIEVSDNGAGINREKVRAIAASKGIIAPDATLTDAEIDDLIFAPGFSTASAISDVSGRGVGMDVVRRSIQALGGRITISSNPGHGTTFTLSLPLTLAVLDGMVVTVAGQTLVVPLTSVIETLQPRKENIHGLGDKSNVMASRGSFIPFIDVGRELGYRSDSIDPMQSVTILVETETHTQNALLVDEIIGQQQVVIKSLETNYGPVVGVAAATILGDGRVALILDVDGIVTGMRSDQVEPRREAA